MTDWQTVRFDPTYEEKLDPEIISLCDALNAAKIVTTQSCCGHGIDWARVWFEHSTDEYIEKMARFVINNELGDYRHHFTMFQKEILIEGYQWCLEIHCNNVYANTSQSEFLAESVIAINEVAYLINQWKFLHL